MSSNISEQLHYNLALQDPNRYRNLLLQQLKTRTFLGDKLWNIASHRILNERLELNLDVTTAEGTTSLTTCRLILGVEPRTIESRRQDIFEPDFFSYADDVLYTFNHEAAQLFLRLIWRAYDGHFGTTVKQSVLPFYQLEKQIEKSRETKNQGLSLLGGYEYYRKIHPSLQAEEDMTEMINMFTFDPYYFSRYLCFLSAKLPKKYRDTHHLLKINEQKAKKIFMATESAVTALLDFAL